MKLNTRRFQFVAAACMLMLAGGRADAAGNSHYAWSLATGCALQHVSAANTTCWLTNDGGEPVPGPNSLVSIAQSLPTGLSLEFGSESLTAFQLSMGGDLAPVQLNMRQGSLQANSLVVGYSKTAVDLGRAQGSFVQSGGAVSIEFLQVYSPTNQVSDYRISGGVFAATAAIILGGFYDDRDLISTRGRFTLTGTGQVTTGKVVLSHFAELQIQGGSMQLNALESVGGIDALSFTGGTLEFVGKDSSISIASAGNANLGFGNFTGDGMPTLKFANTNADLSAINLYVGEAGIGALQVDALGTLRVANAALGKGRSLFYGSGTAAVNGGTWTVAGALDVGINGRGALSITHGGTVTSSSGRMGATISPDASWGRNRADIQGSGSNWTVAGALALGGSQTVAGQGSDLMVSDGGRVQVDGRLQMWGNASVTIDRATLSAGSLVGATGSSITFNGGQLTIVGDAGLDDFKGSLNWSAGSLYLPSANFLVGAGTAIGPSLTLDRGKQLSLGGGLTILSQGDMRFAGGSLSVGGGVLNLGQLTIQGNMPQTLVTGLLLAANGSTTSFVQGLSTALLGAVYVQPGAVVEVSGDAQAFFLGPVVEMTGSHVFGPGLARYEGGLSIESGDGNWLGQPHSLGIAMHSGPVAFGDLNVDSVDVGTGGATDRLVVDGPLSFAGTLRLSAIGGYTAQVGDRYQLFDFTRSSGYFTLIDDSGLALAQGLALDTSRLYVDGSITVQAVPEPAQWMLLLGGLAGVCAARRRRPLLGQGGSVPE